MATPTTTTAPEAPAVKRGFGNLPCILCGQEATVRLDLDDCGTFTCTECEESFTAADVATHLAKWRRVLDWICTAPVAE